MVHQCDGWQLEGARGLGVPGGFGASALNEEISLRSKEKEEKSFIFFNCMSFFLLFEQRPHILVLH